MPSPGRPPALIFGESTGDNVTFRDGSGEVCLPESAVVPILKQERLEPHGSGNFSVVGTGFFISQGILVTAEHVLADVLGPDGKPGCAIGVFQFINHESILPRHIVHSTHRERTDVAVAICASVRHVNSNEPPANNVLRITEHAPPIGSDIFTFAYPLSAAIDSSSQQVTLRQGIFRGHLVASLPNGRDSSMLPGPCFQTTMVIHGGASGGPVFDSKGRVFAVNSTGYTDDQLSFVSSIHTIFDLLIPQVRLSADAEPRDMTVRELADAGLVAVEN